MVNKRVLSLFFAISVLVLPMTTSCEYSLKGFKDWAYNLAAIDKKAAEKLMTPALIFAGIIAMSGLWYWIYKRPTNGGKKDESMTFRGEQSHSSTMSKAIVDVVPTLEQLNVYSQFKSDGGGAASCGYQTLLRSMQVVKGLSEHEPMDELKKTLMDSDSIQAYFGTANSNWRKDIIEKRKADEFKKELHRKFISTLKPGGDDKAKELYKSALGFLEDTVIVISKDPKRNIKQYDFTDEAIKGYIAKSLEELKNTTNEALVEELQASAVINQYFDLQKMRSDFLSQDFLLNLPTLINQIHNRPNLQSDFTGEWLSDGEVEYLWEYHKIDIVPQEVKCGFKAIANFELVGNPNIDIEFDEVALHIKDDIKPLLNKKRELFQVFALGTMRQGSDTVGTRGHWYPLVMHQNTDGKRKYYIMDSSNNANRRNDKNAKKIIDMIEAKAQ